MFVMSIAFSICLLLHVHTFAVALFVLGAPDETSSVMSCFSAGIGVGAAVGACMPPWSWGSVVKCEYKAQCYFEMLLVLSRRCCHASVVIQFVSSAAVGFGSSAGTFEQCYELPLLLRVILPLVRCGGPAFGADCRSYSCGAIQASCCCWL
ncbi:hypothetical protein U1Q18_016538 [Sarracenia purpurea var. burkii]